VRRVGRAPRGVDIVGGVLRIARETHDEIVAHARRDHPDEACGVVAGPAGSDRPERFVPMVNAARSPTFYEFDSQDLLRLYREMDDRDEEPVVIYHSHTATEAYPSRTDVSLAMEPYAHYVLVSTREPDEVEFRSFRIVDGVVTEERVEVVEGLGDDAETGDTSGQGVRPSATGQE
jgi:[CysO sulfur-carrier protein]-S-L-cysteine hydrolase